MKGSVGDQPAFPRDYEYHVPSLDGGSGMAVHSSGMTLRQYYIGLALQGFCANSADEILAKTQDGIAALAISHADATITRLNRERDDAQRDPT